MGGPTPKRNHNAEKEMEPWRIRIDNIDEKLVELLNERAGYALEIGDIKHAYKIPIYSPQREDDIFNRIQAVNKGPLSDQAIIRLFERIIDENRRLERERDRPDR